MIQRQSARCVVVRLRGAPLPPAVRGTSTVAAVNAPVIQHTASYSDSHMPAGRQCSADIQHTASDSGSHELVGGSVSARGCSVHALPSLRNANYQANGSSVLMRCRITRACRCCHGATPSCAMPYASCGSL